MTPKEYLEIVHIINELKDTPRHCVTKNNRVESVAEHSWRIAMMALLLEDTFSDVDIDKVMRMCIIHDLGECFTGDIPVFLKTNEDRQQEAKLLDEFLDTLPEQLSHNMRALYQEMEACQSREAKIFKALDKLEAVIQHNEAPISSWEDHEYDLQRHYAFDVVAFSSWLSELREEILQETEYKIQQGQ